MFIELILVVAVIVLCGSVNLLLFDNYKSACTFYRKVSYILLDLLFNISLFITSFGVLEYYGAIKTNIWYNIMVNWGFTLFLIFFCWVVNYFIWDFCDYNTKERTRNYILIIFNTLYLMMILGFLETFLW